MPLWYDVRVLRSLASAAPVRQCIRANRRVCAAIERRLPQRQLDISLLYERTVGKKMRDLPAGSIIVDAGGGRLCPYAEYKPAGLRIIAVDSTDEDLRRNIEADEWRVADITSHLPFASGEVAIVTSKHVLEHLPDTGRFTAEARRVLKPDGWFINLFPGRNSAFAVLSRLLPDRLKQRLVHNLHPETAGTHRFHTWYDRCYSSAFRRLLEDHGFVVEQEVVSYYQSHYFGFFVPLYLLSVLWEFILMAFRARDSAATILIVARRR
ncbi:class I SAM-dependent methyltransferase [candidate division WOR-3 bacterium]|nr:class I SAM-dependent methyltransferase [candidate division WOR-3 bacterium]